MTNAQRPTPDDPTWRVNLEGYDPSDEGRREALCALGNGYMLTRAAGFESTADGTHYPGLYRVGLYNRHVRVVEGEPVEDESLVNPPNWLPLELRLGVLRRDLRFRDPEGRESTLRETRVVSMAQAHLAG